MRRRRLGREHEQRLALGQPTMEHGQLVAGQCIAVVRRTVDGPRVVARQLLVVGPHIVVRPHIVAGLHIVAVRSTVAPHTGSCRRLGDRERRPMGLSGGLPPTETTHIGHYMRMERRIERRLVRPTVWPGVSGSPEHWLMPKRQQIQPANK